MLDRAKPSKNQPKATIPSTNLFDDGRSRRRLMFLIVVLASLAIDVASKISATASLSDRLIRFGPLTLRLIHNRGIDFSAGSRVPPAVLIAATTVVVCVISVAGLRGRLRPPLAAGMITGGAVATSTIGSPLAASLISSTSAGGRCSIWPTSSCLAG